MIRTLLMREVLLNIKMYWVNLLGEHKQLELVKTHFQGKIKRIMNIQQAQLKEVLKRILEEENLIAKSKDNNNKLNKKHLRMDYN